MAHYYTSASYHVVSMGSLTNGLGACTVSGTVVKPSTTDNVMFGLENGAGNEGVAVYWAGTTLYAIGNNASYWQASTAQSQTGLLRITIVFDGALTGTNRFKVYINGTQVTAGTQTGSFLTTLGNSYTLDLGRNSGANATNMTLQEVGVWSAAFDQALVTSLAGFFRPFKILPSSLLAYLPLVSDTSELMRGLTVTTTGTPIPTSHTFAI